MLAAHSVTSGGIVISETEARTNAAVTGPPPSASTISEPVGGRLAASMDQSQSITGAYSPEKREDPESARKLLEAAWKLPPLTPSSASPTSLKAAAQRLALRSVDAEYYDPLKVWRLSHISLKQPLCRGAIPRNVQSGPQSLFIHYFLQLTLPYVGQVCSLGPPGASARVSQREACAVQQENQGRDATIRDNSVQSPRGCSSSDDPQGHPTALRCTSCRILLPSC
jgi:hypothetical protein